MFLSSVSTAHKQRAQPTVWLRKSPLICVFEQPCPLPFCVRHIYMGPMGMVIKRISLPCAWEFMSRKWWGMARWTGRKSPDPGAMFFKRGAAISFCPFWKGKKSDSSPLFVRNQIIPYFTYVLLPARLASPVIPLRCPKRWKSEPGYGASAPRVMLLIVQGMLSDDGIIGVQSSSSPISN